MHGPQSGCKMLAQHTVLSYRRALPLPLPTGWWRSSRSFRSQRALKGAAEGGSRGTTPPYLFIPFFFVVEFFFSLRCPQAWPLVLPSTEAPATGPPREGWEHGGPRHVPIAIQNWVPKSPVKGSGRVRPSGRSPHATAGGPDPIFCAPSPSSSQFLCNPQTQSTRQQGVRTSPAHPRVTRPRGGYGPSPSND